MREYASFTGRAGGSDWAWLLLLMAGLALIAAVTLAALIYLLTSWLSARPAFTDFRELC